jgi:hypothetical protein
MGQGGAVNGGLPPRTLRKPNDLETEEASVDSRDRMMRHGSATSLASRPFCK